MASDALRARLDHLAQSLSQSAFELRLTREQEDDSDCLLLRARREVVRAIHEVLEAFRLGAFKAVPNYSDLKATFGDFISKHEMERESGDQFLFRGVWLGVIGWFSETKPVSLPEHFGKYEVTLSSEPKFGWVTDEECFDGGLVEMPEGQRLTLLRLRIRDWCIALDAFAQWLRDDSLPERWKQQIEAAARHPATHFARRLDRAAADLTDYGLTPSVRAAIVADLLNRDGTDQTPGLLVEVYNLLVRENQFPKLHDLIRETIGTVAKLVSLDRFPSDRTEPRNEAAKLREMADKLRTWQRRRVFGSDLDGGPPDVGMGFRPTADEAAHLSSNANAIASVVEAAVQRGLGVPRNALCPAVCDLASWFAQWSAEMGGTNLLADWSPAVGHALTDLSQLVELLTQHCRDESGGARFDERIPLDSIPDSIVAAMRSCAAELKAWSDAANEYIATGKVSERLPGLLVAEVRNEIEYTHEMISSNPAPLDESTTLAFTHQPASKRLKRSTERGEARRKQIAALTKHHQYADGGCLNTDPIGVNELAKLADVAPSTASVFFNTEFAGHVKYRAKCTDASTLADALKALRGEFRPAELSRMTQEAFEAGKRRSEDD